MQIFDMLIKGRSYFKATSSKGNYNDRLIIYVRNDDLYMFNLEVTRSTTYIITFTRESSQSEKVL